MMSKRIGLGMAAAGLLLVGMFVPTACTEKDNYFGSEFIPPHQVMKTLTDSSIRIATFIDKYDSVQTTFDDQYLLLVGSLVDPLTGRMNIQGFTNYVPYGFTHTDYFGVDPVIDSMTFGLIISDTYGDTTVSRYVDMYEVNGNYFSPDSVYFSTFPIEQYVDLTASPLCSFEIKGPQTYVVKMPIDYARGLLDETPGETNIYYDDTLFLQKYSGLYFKLRDEQPAGEGTFYQIDLSQSVMNLFYHNKGYTHTDTMEPDTTTQRFLFFGDYVFWNTNFVTVQHNYAEADPSQKGINAPGYPTDPGPIGDTINESEYMYIEGLASLMGKLKVNKDDLDEIKRKTQEAGYEHVALLKAELQVTLANPTADEYEKTFTGLAMYYEMLKPDFLEEYNPVLENISGSGYVSTLGGGLSRSKGKYILNVTSYLQRLFTGRETRYMTELGMDYNSQNAVLRSLVYGSNTPDPENRPLLILTYTMTH